MLYTGSVLPNSPDGYAGAGLEIVQDSGSYFRFSTGTKPGIDIKTPTFFLGDENTSISGSNGNISISGSNLDLRSDTFFLGGNASFVSGANGNIEIFSSDFHLDNDGSVTMQGTITATAGGDIGGWHIGTTQLTSSNGEVVLDADGPYHISSSGFNVSSSGEITATAGTIGGWKIQSDHLVDVNNRLKLEPTGDYIISSSNFQVTSTGAISASAGSIGGFAIGSDNLTATNFILNTTDKKISLGTSNDIFIADANAGIQLGHASFASAPFSVTKAGVLKAESGVIGGWSIQANDLTGGNMIIRDDGTIESSNFASNVPGSGFRLTANNGGFLEVENARIRGTLSTTVFEKEAVNAVGGQLYIANSSVLTGSIVAPGGVHTATTTTMSLENVSGFSEGEILTAKKVHATGFATEYIRVQSSSRFDQTSDTNFAGFIYVIRGYSGSAAAGTDSGSLGDLASSAQSYSGSQVIVSTGKVGTGYIRLNANPNDPYTPYIDIVERTGSAIYDVDLKVRLGDLSGLSQGRLHGTNPTSAGFGLYSQNVFLEGGIVANTGSIAGIHMDAGKLYTGDGVHEGSGTGFYLDSGSNFSLGDKLTWDGNALTVKGSIQLSDGSNVGNGMIWSGSWSLAETYYKNDAVEFSGSSYIAVGPDSHVSSNLNKPPLTAATWSLMSNSGSDGVLGGDGADAKVVSFTSDDYVIIYDTAGSNPVPATITLSGSSQNFTDAYFLISGSTGGGYPGGTTYLDGSGTNTTSSVFTSPSSYVAGSQTLRMSVSEGSGGTEVSFDTLTITSLKTAIDGIDSVAPPLVTLEAPQLTFVRASDGTITPATASFTASLQNTLSPTASWTTDPAVTFLTGSSLDLTKMYLTKDNFGANTSVRITVRSGSDHSDSVTMILLEDGTNTVQTVVSNPTHTFQAANDGTVSNFAGGGTTLQVFEGATELTYTSSFIVPAGHYSASLSVDNLTAGTFSGDGSTTTTLSIPTAMSETSGAIHITVSGSRQNGTSFILPTTQSFAKSTAGAVGNTGQTGASAKGVIVNGTTHIFTKDVTGTITPISASFTASLNNATDHGEWETTLGSFASFENNYAGPPTCVVTRDTFVDGMQISYTMNAADNSFADHVTLKLIDAGSGNIQPIISNQSHTFQADHTGSVTSFAGGGTTLQVFEGATALTYTSSAITPSGFYSSSFVSNNITPGALSGNDTTTALFATPTAMSDNTAELRISVSGSSQNGTSFVLPVTQSFAKSIAGAEPITVIQTNEAHTFVGDSSGDVTSHNGSETTISVFEGVAQLQAVPTIQTPNSGEFKVTTSGTNITPGSPTVDGLNAAVSNMSSATETSGSVTYTISGKDISGTAFTRTKTQTFTVAIAGDTGAQGDTGTTGDTGATGPNFDFLTGSLSEIDTTGGIATGLLLTSDVFGFHGEIAEGDGTAATLSDFTSFLDSSGNFYLGSGSGDLGAGYFAWNNAAKSLLISGSAVNIQVPKFYLGGSSQYISGSNGNIEISSSNFHLRADGDVVMQGNVTASGIRIEGNSTFQGDVTITNTNGGLSAPGEISPNPFLNIISGSGAHVRPVGIKAVYGDGTTTNITSSIEDGVPVLKIKNVDESDATIGAGWPAFAVNPAETYKIRVSFKGSVETSTGIFIRIQELDTDLGTNTHTSNGVNEAGTIAATRDLSSNAFKHVSDGSSYVSENGPVLTTYTTVEGLYTPTSTSKFASLVVLSWTNIGGAESVYVREASIKPVSNNFTRIVGNQISTGIIESTNLSGTVGSQLDLDGGTIKLGGTTAPSFAVSKEGAVTSSAGLIGGWEIGTDSLSGGNMQISASGHITTNTDTDKTRIVIDGSTDPSEIQFFSGSVNKFEFTTDIYAQPEQPFVTGSGGAPSCLAATNTGISGIQLNHKTSGIVSSISGQPESISIVPGRVYIHGKQSSSLQPNTEQLKVRRDIYGCLGTSDLDTPSPTAVASFEYQGSTADPGKYQRIGVRAEVSLTHADNDGTPIAVYADAQNVAGATGNPYSFYGNSGSLYNRGEARFGADVIAFYSSDRRFKDNIFVIESPIDKIKKISGVEFDWNDKGPAWTRSEEFGNPSGSLHDVGVVAQEIQEILPEAVKTRKDGYLAVDYEKIIPLLIEGIKEQQTTIEDLNARIKKLENN